MQTMVVRTRRAGPLVMMEQRSSHQVNGVQEAIEAVDATLAYCPASALDVSPIAACWLVAVVAHGVNLDDLAPFPRQRQLQRVGIVPRAGLWRDIAQQQPLRSNPIKP
jgi:hypothetical protein